MKRTITLKKPLPGQRERMSVEGRDFLVDFDQDSVVLGREGLNLEIVFPDDGVLILEDYFTLDDASPPRFTLPDGAELDVPALLGQQGILPGSSSDSSGVGEYVDFSGNALDGIGRTLSLESSHWDGIYDYRFDTVRELAPQRVGNDPAIARPLLLRETPPGTPADPATPPTDLPDFNDRFVLYLDQVQGRAVFPRTTGLHITGPVQDAHPAYAAHPSFGGGGERRRLGNFRHQPGPHDYLHSHRPQPARRSRNPCGLCQLSRRTRRPSAHTGGYQQRGGL